MRSIATFLVLGVLVALVTASGFAATTIQEKDKVFEGTLQKIDIDFESMSRDLEDDELARDLLPELLVGSSQAVEKQVELSNLEREAHESIFALRSMKLEGRQRALRMEIDEAQRAAVEHVRLPGAAGQLRPAQ